MEVRDLKDAPDSGRPLTLSRRSELARGTLLAPMHDPAWRRELFLSVHSIRGESWGRGLGQSVQSRVG